MLRPREIAHGIESFAARTPTLPPATHTNSYALGARDVLLVEPATPYQDEQRAWLDWVRGLEQQARRPIAIFVTHHHADHVAGAELFARELGLPVWAHALTKDRLPSLPIARVLEDGESIILDGPHPQRWDVLHTPGHAPGHLCLFESSSRHVVVGDMVASVGTILIEPVDGDMRVYLAELARLERLGSLCALPAHGEPIHNPSALFQFYIAHRNMREERVLLALRGHGTVGATAQRLLPAAYADTAEEAWPLALLSLQAHLVKLVADGVVTIAGERFIAA